MRGSVLRHRDVSLIVGAVGLSALGDFLLFIPLAIHLAEKSANGFVMAALPLTLWAPVVLLAGPAGLLADRLDRRRLLILASVAQAWIAAAIAFVDAPAAILVLTALLGIGFAVAQPAEFALVPAIAPAGRVTEVNGYVETARYVGMAAGPVIGGALAAAGGMRTALLVNALTFAIVALAAAVLRARPAVTAARSAPGRARDGLTFLLRDPTLAVVMVVAFVSLLFMSAQIPAEVFFIKDVVGAGEVGFGIAFTVWFGGMALGALALARRVGAAAMAFAALVATVVQGGGLAVPAIWPVFAVTLCAFLVGGTAHGIKNVLVRTLIHERVPDELRGRAFAAYNGIRNGAELIALMMGGALLGITSPRWILLLAGGASAATAAVALVLARRRLAEGAPEAAAVLSA